MEFDLASGVSILEGEHPALGRVTLRQLLASWVAHDLGHISQAYRVMAKQFRDAVGPWRAYLTIMDRCDPGIDAGWPPGSSEYAVDS